MMTSTFAEIEALYAEKIAPHVGTIKAGIKSVDWLFKGSIAITFILNFTLYFRN
jgi:hypothetical protein